MMKVEIHNIFIRMSSKVNAGTWNYTKTHGKFVPCFNLLGSYIPFELSHNKEDKEEWRRKEEDKKGERAGERERGEEGERGEREREGEGEEGRKEERGEMENERGNSSRVVFHTE